MPAPAPPREDTAWRTARASRAALVVDAADYFAHARAAMLAAERRIMLIGWDFDARIRLGDPGEDGAPARSANSSSGWSAAAPASKSICCAGISGW